MDSGMKGVALSVDLESWTHVFSFQERERCSLDGGFIKKSTEKLLDIFREHDAKATFFVVGEIFEWYPEVIKKIKEEGHEIAYHSHSHNTLNEDNSLKENIKCSWRFIKRFRPIGFRAPQCFLREEELKVLKENSFVYDSSSYGPVSACCNIEGILEIPVSTRPLLFSPKAIDLPRNLSLGLLAKEIPYGSGLFLALMGSKVSLLSGRGYSIFFVHPWQILRPTGAHFKRCLRYSPMMRLYFRDRKGSFEKLMKKCGSITMKELAERLKTNK